MIWPVVAVLGIALIADLRAVPPDSTMTALRVTPAQDTRVIPRQKTAPVHYMCSKPDPRSAVTVLTPIEEGAKTHRILCVNCECPEAK